MSRSFLIRAALAMPFVSTVTYIMQQTHSVGISGKIALTEVLRPTDCSDRTLQETVKVVYFHSNSFIRFIYQLPVTSFCVRHIHCFVAAVLNLLRKYIKCSFERDTGWKI
jgi:hypothetical protein